MGVLALKATKLTQCAQKWWSQSKQNHLYNTASKHKINPTDAELLLLCSYEKCRIRSRGCYKRGFVVNAGMLCCWYSSSHHMALLPHMGMPCLSGAVISGAGAYMRANPEKGV